MTTGLGRAVLSEVSLLLCGEWAEVGQAWKLSGHVRGFGVVGSAGGGERGLASDMP